MNARELMEAAAKAAGYTVVGWDNALPDTPIVVGERHCCGGAVKWVWMPLCDDGDALRLAVTRAMAVRITPHGAAAKDGSSDDWRLVALDEVADVHAATRRAIVRAAAEVGKGMP